ncbi:hypothetical protein RUM44_010805 [Polyplax serrata]|uniref:Uncharacterized protein n=1 Tax=Polyplax serrata TaxID=468196 RepID=A0ABR1AN97_POLSC
METGSLQLKTPPKLLAKNENDTVESNAESLPKGTDNTDKNERISSSEVTPKKQSNHAELVEFKTPEKTTSTSFENGRGYTTPNKSSTLNKTGKLDTQTLGINSEIKAAVNSCEGLNSTDKEKTEDEAQVEAEAEEGMMSEVEQAKLLLAASENYYKALEKTPVKQVSSRSPQHSLKNSPGTPGRHKRVELITLDSPKSKKMKQY